MENQDSYNGFEVYPMPFFGMLVAEDPAALARWYEQALGFGVMFAGPVVHLRRRKYQDLLVAAAAPGHEATAGGPSLHFDADGEVDSLAARAAAVPQAGRSSVGEPVDTAWNTRELRVVDPAGHRLLFWSRRSNPDPAIEAAWRSAFDAFAAKRTT